MSNFSKPIGQLFSGMNKGMARQAMRVGLRHAVDTMSMGSVGGGAAAGAALTVGRNLIQGRDTFDGVVGGAVGGAVARHAYRAAWHGNKFMSGARGLAGMARAGQRGTPKFASLLSDLQGSARRARAPLFQK